MRQSKFRVVLVEDDASLRRLNKMVLERSGRFEVVGEASDGAEAIQVTKSTQPALVLLDLAMPRMGGLEALPELRRVAPAAKVVALSMLQATRYAEQAVASGAVAFIDKSVRSSTLVARLIEIMEGGEAARANGGPPPGRLSLAVSGSLVRRILAPVRPRPLSTA